MPQVETLAQPPDAAIVSTAARTPGGAVSTVIMPMVMSISDIIIPGLGMTISAVLVAIKKLCERLLKRKQERLVRISKRLTDLYELAKKMEAQHRFLPSDWLERYRDLVGRFQAFMVSCEERHVVVRLVNGSRENREVRAFEEHVDSLYGSMEFQERGGGGCCVQ
ncbi:hypothetical protein Gpo141_00010846 [Globisporangium polare]